MQFRHKIRSIIAAGTIGAIALAFGASATAYADPSADPSATATITYGPSVVDPNKTGTLTITKYEQPTSTGTPADGTQSSAPKGDQVIPGVGYQVIQVPGIDLTTNEGWTAAAEMTVANAKAAINAETPAPVPPTIETDDNGQAVFTSLPLGLYLVKEAVVPQGVTAADPFLVTMPITDPSNHNQWLYDVYVYPKNAETGITKSVVDSKAYAVGDQVTYILNGDIPRDNPISGYKIDDPIDPKLTVTTSDISVCLADLTTGTCRQSLTSVDDYQLTVTPGTIGTSKTLIEVIFTSTGLATLAAHEDDSTVMVTINTIVSATGGEIDNVAYVYPDQPAFLYPIDPSTGKPVTTPNYTQPGVPVFVYPDGPNAGQPIPPAACTVMLCPVPPTGGPVPSTPVPLDPNGKPLPPTNPTDPNTPAPGPGVSTVSKFGDINIVKTDSQSKAVVPGAVFEVFASLADATAQTNPLALTDPMDPTKTVTSVTTDKDGKATMSGLRYSSFMNGATVQPTLADNSPNPAYQWYYVVEVKAPDGYALLAGPVKVDVTGSGNLASPTSISDAPTKGNLVLPLTGGTVSVSTSVVYLAGGLLLLGGILVLVYFRRRANSTED